MTQSTSSNGPAPGGGIVLPFVKSSRSNSQAQRLSASPKPLAPSDHRLAAALRQDQRRRAAAAAKAAARRRAVIALVLCLLGMVAGGVVLGREIEMQGMEVRLG